MQELEQRSGTTGPSAETPAAAGSLRERAAGRARRALSRPPELEARETLIAVALSAALALLFVALAPPADDAAAHIYRTLLVRNDVLLWDNYWYGGDYPLASYGMLLYFPAALVGTVPLAVAATIASAGAFASILVRRWGAAAVWPARAFAVFALGPLVTGTYAYALGLALMLLAIRALQSRRRWLSLGFASLTLAASPLAFIFLCLGLVAIVVAQRRWDSSVRLVGAGIALLGLGEFVALRLFGMPGVYPFLIGNLLCVLGVCAAIFLLARGPRPAGDPLVALVAVWALACVVGWAARSPIGDNLDRLRYLAFPLALLAAFTGARRPRFVTVALLACVLSYAAIPDVASTFERAPSQAPQASFWRPAIGFLKAHESTSYRVEVVQTWARWESYWIPQAGFPLARGWYRQLDLAENPLLYQRTIAPADYRAWLRRLAVHYVLLPSVQLDTAGARAEAKLLESGRSGLRLVLQTSDWRIYALPRPTPLLTGPGKAQITAFDHNRIAATVSAPGTYRLRVRYMPFWSLGSGSVCLSKAPDSSTLVHATAAGSFVLSVPDEPTPVMRSIFAGEGSAAC